MKLVLERLLGPAIEPVTLAEMKQHLRAATGNTEDSMINGLIAAAREWVETYTGRVLIDQKWRLSLDWGSVILADINRITPAYGGYFHCTDGAILLFKSPVIAITSFTWLDAVGVETTVAPTAYQLREPNSRWPRLYPINAGWSTGPLRIEYRAGYADQLGSPVQGAEVVPMIYKQAMKLWAEANYDRDEKMMPLLIQAAENLLRPECVDLQLA